MTGRLLCVDNDANERVGEHPAAIAPLHDIGKIGIPAALLAPLEGRIVAIADRAARSVDEAIAIIVSQRGTGFDPAAVDAFLGIAE